MSIKLFNTLHRKVEEFKPVKDNKVGIYSCGPTVYWYAHIGNMRTYIFSDILKRTLKYAGYDVTHVMNVTDVGHLTDDADAGEDKMEKGSRREGLSAWDIAKKYEKAFLEDISKLNIIKPNFICRATEYIKEQIAMVQKLEENGYTYKTSDGIYFDTSKLDNYGELAKINPEGMEAGARVEMGEKKNKTDFALWKFSPKDQKRQMEWDSPWGTGFPGWAIECSAMSIKHLGEYFDIHTGGEDHISTHHPNEMAQNEGAFGHRSVNFWMHGYFMLVDNQRMGKSLGNVYNLSDLTEKGYFPLSYRYLCLTAHYRKQMNFTFTALEAAEKALLRIYSTIYEIKNKNIKAENNVTEKTEKYINKLTDSLYNDLNTATAITNLRDAISNESLSDSEKLYLANEYEKVLGLDLNLENNATIDFVLKNTDITVDLKDLDENIKVLIEKRNTAKENKSYEEADKFRSELEEKGYLIEDLPKGKFIIKKKG